MYKVMKRYPVGGGPHKSDMLEREKGPEFGYEY